MPKVVKQTSGKSGASNAASAGKSVRKGKRKTYNKTVSEPTKRVITSAPRRSTSIGNLQPKRDLTRYVRWPRYVRIQRQKRVLLKRLKVPPSINQFSITLDKEWATKAIKLCAKYRPESKTEKKVRLEKRAEAIAKLPKGEKMPATPKSHSLKSGINHVTSLVEKKEAKLVLIAHDVDPLEIVVWLPALCRKKGVPYAIIKSKSRLGRLVGQKTAAAVALTTVRSEDVAELQKLAAGVSELFNDRYETLRKTWGGGILSTQSRLAVARKENALRNAELKQ